MCNSVSCLLADPGRGKVEEEEEEEEDVVGLDLTYDDSGDDKMRR
jgi:hypothetical protein